MSNENDFRMEDEWKQELESLYPMSSTLLIQGNVVAEKKIEILPPGKVLGNIQAPQIVIDEGAILTGNCQMHQAEKKEEKIINLTSTVWQNVIVNVEIKRFP